MSNLETIQYPIKVISYYVSSVSLVDKRHSYEYWFRGKLIRVLADKPFGRGDMLLVKSITNSGPNTIIDVEVDCGEYEQLPVLSFVSTRLVYNKYSSFDFTTTENIQILKVIDQVIDDNYSVCFIILSKDSGSISASDKYMNNYFDININLSWK